MDFALIAIIAPVLIAIVVGMVSRSLLMAGLMGFLVLAYTALQSGEGLLMGMFLAILLFMVMGTATFFAKTILGDTA